MSIHMLYRFSQCFFFLYLIVTFLFTDQKQLLATESQEFPNCFKGQIYKVAKSELEQAKLTSPQMFFKDLGENPQTILLGERHGVKAHPQMAECLMGQIIRDQKVTFVTELLKRDQQKDLHSYQQKHPEHAAGLGAHLRWWKTGWPEWSIYEPLFDFLWMTRSSIMSADRSSEAKTPSWDVLQKRLGPKADFVRQTWQSAMKQAHCGLIDEKRSSELAEIQIHRDQVMSQIIRVSEGSQEGTVVFYGGRSHVRSDRSIPLQLKVNAPLKRPRISIAFYEEVTSSGPVNKEDVLQKLRGVYDYVWFNGVVKKEDSCTKLKRLGLAKANEGEANVQ